jgi:hypothetical protein
MKVRLVGSDKKKNYLTGSSSVSSSSAFTPLLEGFNQTAKVTDPYKQHVWSYASIKVIATAVAGIPAKFYATGKNDPLTDKNEWVRLFNRPNPLMVGTQFWKFLATYYEDFGSVFIIPRDKDYSKPTASGQMPGTLELVDPRCMQ